MQIFRPTPPEKAAQQHFHLNRATTYATWKRLEAAGLIRVERARRKAPLVEILDPS